METLDIIQSNIGKARAQSALTAGEPVLLGACKGQTAETISQFIEAGLRHFGENRVQEAALKWGEIKKTHPDVTLHLIGPLQTNKAADALALFDVIQTLDRQKLVDEIAKHLPRYESAEARASHELRSMKFPEGNFGSTKKFFVQVNTGEEPQKAGIVPAETRDFVAYCKKLKLNIVGLMCVPPAEDMPAPHFALLRTLAEESDLHELSMGMSGDYETAIRMGSTCVRIGTALFGARSA